MNGRGRIWAVLATAAVALSCVVATTGRGNEIRMVGSDTMLELDRRLAEAYMRSHPGVTVLVDGGGSGVGVKALIDGSTDIAAASRPLLAEEVAALHDRFGALGVRFLIAQDALSVWVNASNPLRDLALGELRGIFGGSIRRWSEVGGDDAPVTVVVRGPSSGTHRFFRDHVLNGAPYAASSRAVATTRDVLAAVASDPAAIGYGGHAYRQDGVVAIAVDGVAPTPEEVGRGRYPLTRYLTFLTTEPPTGLARRFIDWCVSADGQRVVAEVGYLPLWKS